ncbi:MAG TPA: transposase, partial [Pyrinomonadaceae bacterium]|nr:transposase [Pyrinomonadaceae bacterium]
METSRQTYRQNWVSYTAAQVNEKAKFLELLYALCENVAEPPQRMGRPRIPLADRLFSSVFKVYSTLSGRRFTSDLMEAKRRGYLSTVPTYSAVFRYFESEELTPILKQLIIESSLPLKSVEENFAADSTGFRVKGYSTWFSTKYDRCIDKSEWVKCHVMCGTLTNVVTAVEVSSRKDHDSPYFPTLLDRTAESGFKIK